MQILYEDAIKFLSSFGPVSSENRKFLQAVYANAVFDTIYVILNSTMSPAEKLRQYRTIATASGLPGKHYGAVHFT